MQPTETAALLCRIKQELRSVMNGPVSASMREKGLTYKVNFGVELPRLRQMSAGLPHDYDLAAALWREDIRECRLLAGMLMPVERFDGALADEWVSQMRFTEEAECTTMSLFSRAPWASAKAFEWIASAAPMPQLCGYLLLARLFARQMRPSERDSFEFLDQAAAALKDGAYAVRLAARKALVKFMDLGEREEAQGEELLRREEEEVTCS